MHGLAWRGRFPGGAEQGWRSGWGDSAIHLARSRERSTLLSWLSRGVVSGAVGVVMQPCFLENKGSGVVAPEREAKTGTHGGACLCR
jgi:hypothetical protein